MNGTKQVQYSFTSFARRVSSKSEQDCRTACIARCSCFMFLGVSVSAGVGVGVGVSVGRRSREAAVVVRMSAVTAAESLLELCGSALKPSLLRLWLRLATASSGKVKTVFL